MKTLTVIFCISLLFGYSLAADQLAYLDRETAVHVEQYLRKRELIATFCSECPEDVVTVWHLHHAEARYTGDGNFFELHVSAHPLIRSRRPIANDEVPSQVGAEYVNPKSIAPESFPIDLAYTYIWHENQWICMGKYFGLDCEVRVEEFRL